MNLAHDARGFTLVELLTVVGIIGVLAVLAIPNYFFAKKNALNAQAVSDMRSILPAADNASSSDPIPAGLYTITGGGGPIAPELEPARSSNDIRGGVLIGPNLYRVWTYHPSGSVCYSYFSDLSPSFRAQDTSGANVCGA